MAMTPQFSPPPAGSASKVSRPTLLALIALLSVGAALRLIPYLDRRSLWLDEAWLSLNIVQRSFIGLIGELDFRQTAPLGFLWGEHAMVSVFGVNELALRAIPLLGGVALLWAVWRIAQRWLGPQAALVAVGMAALSPPLIYYSNEVKPYVVEALLTVVMVTLAFNVLEAPDSRRRWWWLIGGGALALLVSNSVLFVLASAGLALTLRREIVGTPLGRRRIAIAGATWVGLFALLYFFEYRSVALGKYMQAVWASAFLPPQLPRLLRFAYDTSRDLWIQSFFGGETNPALPPKTMLLVAVLSVSGVVWLVRRYGISMAALLLGPFVATGGASLMRRWPLAPRLLVFLLPLLILMFVAGLRALVGWLSPRTRGVALAAAGFLLIIPPSVHGLATVRAPLRRDHVAPLIGDFMRFRGNSALMYVFNHATPPWLLYTADWKAPRDERFQYAWRRARVTEHYGTRGCIFNQPGVRTVFGDAPVTMDPSVWAEAEAEWFAAQPDEEIWLLFLGYDKKYLHPLRAALTRAGATEIQSFAPEDPALYQYRFPPGPRTSFPVDCQQR